MDRSDTGTFFGLKLKGFEGLELSAILKKTEIQIGFGKYNMLGALKYLSNGLYLTRRSIIWLVGKRKIKFCSYA